MAHPADKALESLARGTLTTAQSLRLQTHIFHCPECLQRLVRAEVLLMLEEAVLEPRHLPRPDRRRPLFIRHDTADGFIYSRVKKRGKKWLVVHWGEQLDGQWECSTMREANEHAMAAFAQMFPEHRCTERCCLNPPAPE